MTLKNENLYATKQTFSGQRASLGRNVLVKRKGRIEARMIEEIDFDLDAPRFSWPQGTYSQTAEFSDVLRHVEVQSEDDIKNMPDSSWCWLPRV